MKVLYITSVVQWFFFQLSEHLGEYVTFRAFRFMLVELYSGTELVVLIITYFGSSKTYVTTSNVENHLTKCLKFENLLFRATFQSKISAW